MKGTQHNNPNPLDPSKLKSNPNPNPKPIAEKPKSTEKKSELPIENLLFIYQKNKPQNESKTSSCHDGVGVIVIFKIKESQQRLMLASERYQPIKNGVVIQFGVGGVFDVKKYGDRLDRLSQIYSAQLFSQFSWEKNRLILQTREGYLAHRYRAKREESWGAPEWAYTCFVIEEEVTKEELYRKLAKINSLNHLLWSFGIFFIKLEEGSYCGEKITRQEAVKEAGELYQQYKQAEKELSNYIPNKIIKIIGFITAQNKSTTQSQKELITKKEAVIGVSLAKVDRENENELAALKQMIKQKFKLTSERPFEELLKESDSQFKQPHESLSTFTKIKQTGTVNFDEYLKLISFAEQQSNKGNIEKIKLTTYECQEGHIFEKQIDVSRGCIYMAPAVEQLALQCNKHFKNISTFPPSHLLQSGLLFSQKKQKSGDTEEEKQSGVESGFH